MVEGFDCKTKQCTLHVLDTTKQLFMFESNLKSNWALWFKTCWHGQNWNLHMDQPSTQIIFCFCIM